MAKNPFELSKEFFGRLAGLEEAKGLMREEGDRVAQFVMTDGEPFYVRISREGASTVVEGTAEHADVRIETNAATCEEMLRPLGTSFTKLRKELRVWTRPPAPWGLAWFGMLVRMGQGR